MEELVKGNDVVLFMKGSPQQPMCGFSNYVVQMLKFYGVEKYAYLDVLQDEELRQKAKDWSQWPTFPQLYLKGELIGGCDILSEMHKNKEFDKLLKDKEVKAD